jgi:hypothetical protein
VAVTFLTLGLAFAGAALAVLLADPQWASGHAWLGPWLWIAAGVFLLLSLVAWWFRNPKKTAGKTAQNTQGHSSPAIIAREGSTVHVEYGAERSEPEKRPYVKPVEYCETVEAEFLSVINEGERAYDLYTEPLRLGEWVMNFNRLPELKGEGNITILRLAKLDKPNEISTLQKLDHAWRETERANPNFAKPWVRIHYKDHKDNPFLSQCRMTRFRDVRGQTTFRFLDFSDLPETNNRR